MSTQTTRGAHRASRQRRWFKRTRPACGFIPVPFVPDVSDEAPVVPSTDLPDGHMAERPHVDVVLAITDTGWARIGHYEPATYVARVRDEVEVIDESSLHFGRSGVVDAVDGDVLPVAVVLPGGVVFCEHAQLGLVRRAADDTLILDALAELDDVPLTGGAR